MGHKIVAAMSGGVDSSTAAALLKQEGRDVIGVGLRLPEPLSEDGRGCCGIAGMDDARRVADKVGIPFYVLDYQKIFEKSVIDYFCRSYLDGKTPNPCVECNRVVKFGRLLEAAGSFGADYIATGHYARICRDDDTGRYLLKKGIDMEKDQSYFLYCLSQDQLSRTIFPLGEMTKDETRRLAESFGLKVAAKPGSQDICFVGDGNYRNFLADRCPESLRPGPIVNRNGDVLGEHQGIASYTVGQRRGVGVAAGVPLYVLSVDASTSTVVVGEKEEMLRNSISVTNTNWISIDEHVESMELGVKIRYRHSEIPAIVSREDNGRARVTFLDSQTVAAAPGQSAVFYDGNVVVGGGIIE